MVIRVDRQAAARYGLIADDILAVVQAGIGGEAVRKVEPFFERGEWFVISRVSLGASGWAQFMRPAC